MTLAMALEQSKAQGLEGAYGIPPGSHYASVWISPMRAEPHIRVELFDNGVKPNGKKMFRCDDIDQARLILTFQYLIPFDTLDWKVAG